MLLLLTFFFAFVCLVSFGWVTEPRSTSLVTLSSVFNKGTSGKQYDPEHVSYSRSTPGIRLVIFCGTRPEIVKLAPLIGSIKLAKLDHLVVFTGQHPDIAEPFRKYWEISFNTVITDVFEKGQTLASLVGHLLTGIERQVGFSENDVWVLQGDTSTSLAAGMVAFYRGTPFIHLEAGLRTFNHAAPFPEEANRRTLSLLASLHIAPTSLSEFRLIEQGVERDRIYMLGNTGIDAVRLAQPQTVPPSEVSAIRTRLVLVTLHRRENAKRFDELYETIGRLKPQNVSYIVPVHPNPASMRATLEACKKHTHIICVKPFGYGETQWMLANSMFVLTDSGGLQEEATWYGRPVLVFRENTERPEAIDAGSSLLIPNIATLQNKLSLLFDSGSGLLHNLSKRNLAFGDGFTSERVVHLLRNSTVISILRRPIRMVNTGERNALKLKSTVDSNRSGITELGQTISPPRRLVCSRLRAGDRTGSVIHDALFALAYAETIGAEYLGPIGERSDLADISVLLELYGVPFKVLEREPNGCSVLDPREYRNETILAPGLQSVRTHSELTKNISSCVVHVRRGDVTESYPQTGDYFRWWPPLFYLSRIDEHCEGKAVTIHTEGLSEDEHKIFASFGYEIRDSSSMIDAVRDFMTAQVFILSSSSFSYHAAIFAAGLVAYAPFWHKPFPEWILPDAKSAKEWTDVALTFDTITLPCEGGHFGSSTGPTMSVCIISSETTVMFEHPPHAAQTMYNCWSLFQHHGTAMCAFNFEGITPNRFAVWLAHRMGCAIQVTGERCMHVSSYTRSLRVEPGEGFSWFNSESDATELRNAALRHLRQPNVPSRVAKAIGIIQRRRSRKLDLPEIEEIASADIMYMEDSKFDEQISWWNEHHIILASHGAAMWAVPFAEPCTAIIQLYPEHYYPIYFYEQLITESGSVPVSWWPGAYIGTNETLREASAREAIQDFKEHHSNRGKYRDVDIVLSEAELKEIIMFAVREREACLLNHGRAENTSNAPNRTNVASERVVLPPAPFELSLQTCSADGQETYESCAVVDTVDVVLTVFSRDYLDAQLDQVLEQTYVVSHVWIVQNENHVDARGIVETWKQKVAPQHIPVDIVQFSSNSRYHGRFHVAYFMSTAEYVTIWDDDVELGKGWVQHCIETSRVHGDALVGANGRSIVSLLYDASNYSRQIERDGENDFVGHTWTLKRQLLKLFLAEPPVTYVTGEDIQLSYALQKYGIKSVKAKHLDTAFARDTKFTTDKHASFTKDNLQVVRQWLFCMLIKKGFRLLECENCDEVTANMCIELFRTRINSSTQEMSL